MKKRLLSILLIVMMLLMFSASAATAYSADTARGEEELCQEGNTDTVSGTENASENADGETLKISAGEGSGEGGYAKENTPDENSMESPEPGNNDTNNDNEQIDTDADEVVPEKAEEEQREPESVSGTDESSVTLEKECGDVTVRVSYDSAAAGVPADAMLNIHKIEDKDPKYEDCRKNMTEVPGKAGDDILKYSLYDISLTNTDKTKEYEPVKGSRVCVKLVVKNSGQEFGNKVIHFKNDGTVEILDSKVNKTGEAQEIVFETENFSIYAIEKVSPGTTEIVESDPETAEEAEKEDAEIGESGPEIIEEAEKEDAEIGKSDPGTSEGAEEEVTEEEAEKALPAEKGTKDTRGVKGDGAQDEKEATEQVPALKAPSGNNFNPSSNVSIQNGRITLLGDVTMSGQVQINQNENITIDLNGHTLEMRDNGCYFMVNPKGTLTIEDTAGGGIVYNKTYLVWLYNGGTFNLNSGTIDGSKITNAAQLGGAVYLGSPMQGDEVFNMYGGTIRNCHSTQYGGAVYVAAPSSGHHCYFNMYGGSILDCYSKYGGAVYVGSQGTDRSTVHLEGRSTITFLGNYNTSGGRGGAIFSDGKVEISGILDIGHGKVKDTGCDSVYIDKNNWSGYVPEYLDVTGRLVVVGDGYIDLDTNYPAANAVVQGHTVVKNSAGLTPEEFYAYGSYFINSTLGLTVSAGFDPSKNNTTSEQGPSNWHTYNSDTGNFEKQSYIDVMGQEMYVQATSEPGKRQYQDYNYLIYTDRTRPSDPILEYFAVKVIKKDKSTGDLLDGAAFALSGSVKTVYGDATEETVSGISGMTGDASTGVTAGTTYIFTDDSYTQKLMLRDGVYTITETDAPEGFELRSNFATIEIRHENGDISIVIVEANGIRLAQDTYVNINDRYDDQGMLIEHEIVLEVQDDKEEEEPEITWQLDTTKYGTSSTEGNTLGGAVFRLYREDDSENPLSEAVSTISESSSERGIVSFLDTEENEVQLLPGMSYIVTEYTAPKGYSRADDFTITISEDGASATVLQNGTPVSESGTGCRVSIDTTEHRIKLFVVDTAVYSLPETGANGGYLLIGFSVFLMTGCMLIMLRLKRKRT